jgi:hypothetical protein
MTVPSNRKPIPAGAAFAAAVKVQADAGVVVGNFPPDGVPVFLFIPMRLPLVAMRRAGYWFVCVNDNGDGQVLPRDTQVFAWVTLEAARNAGEGTSGVPCPACGVVSPTAKGREAVAAAVGMADGLAGMLRSVAEAATLVATSSPDHPSEPGLAVVPREALDALVAAAEKIGKLGA